MFWGKYEKERLKRTYHAKLSQAISRLEKMDMSSLSQVYYAVATEDRKLVQSGGRAIGMVMEHMTMKYADTCCGKKHLPDSCHSRI